MKVSLGNGKSNYGTGVQIDLTGDEVAEAIDMYLKAKGVIVEGPRTVTVNGELCDKGGVYVDPSGKVKVESTMLYHGRGFVSSSNSVNID